MYYNTQLAKTSTLVNPFHATGFFLYPGNHQKIKYFLMVFRGAKRGQWHEIGDLLYCQCPLYNYYKTMLVILKSICKATFSIDLNHNFIIHVSVYNSENHSSLLSIKHCLLKLHETKIHKCNTSVILHQIKIQKCNSGLILSKWSKMLASCIHLMV